MKFALPVSLLIVGLVAGIGIGYALSPQYAQSMYVKSMDLGQADRLVDLRYVNAMIAHHRGAMLLAEQAQQSERVEVKTLAADILQGEPVLIDELYTWKKDWYRDGRAVKDPIVAQLGAYDETFDLRFLNALLAHHQAGIAMTQEIRVKSSRADVLDNADAVENFLTTTTQTFKDWRKSWYNVE